MSEKKKKRWWERLLIWLGVIGEVADTAESILAERKRARENKKRPDESLKFLPWIFLALAFTSGIAHAIDASVTGVQVTVTYQEPGTSADGSPLSDLSHTTIYHNFGGPKIEAARAPAAAPSGRGLITQTITIPVAENQEVNVEIWATATDLSGNESGESSRVVKRIDRLAPAAPK